MPAFGRLGFRVWNLGVAVDGTQQQLAGYEPFDHGVQDHCWDEGGGRCLRSRAASAPRSRATCTRGLMSEANENGFTLPSHRNQLLPKVNSHGWKETFKSFNRTEVAWRSDRTALPGNLHARASVRSKRGRCNVQS